MKQIMKREIQGGHPVSPKINISIPQYSTDGIAVSIEVRIIPMRSPLCPHCGQEKKRVIGALWICPNCVPDPSAAIPLKGEGENVIDIEPDEARRAA